MMLIPEVSNINNRKLKSEIFLRVRLHTEFSRHIATLINRLFCSWGGPSMPVSHHGLCWPGMPQPPLLQQRGEVGPSLNSGAAE